MYSDTRLPVMDDNARLEDESLDALRNLLPKNRLLIKDERIRDYGIDMSFEVVVGRYVTNSRACVQVKARSNSFENADGSVSLSIKTTTLNYLLNGSSPILILYRKHLNEFRFAFLRDHISGIQKANPAWLQQEELTLRLTNILIDDCIDEICSRITSESDMHRSICNGMAACNSALGVELSINPATLTVSTAQDAKDVLTENGIAFVSYGYAEYVLKMAKLIPEKELSCYLLFVLGYASFSRGQYLLAKHHLSLALAESEQLEKNQENLIQSYSLACNYYLGMISREEYLEKSTEFTVKMCPNMRYQNHLIQLREKMLSESDFTVREEIRENIREYATEVMQDTSIEERIRDSAELSLLEIEIETAINRMSAIISIAMNPVMEKLRMGAGSSSRFGEYKESVDKLEAILSDLQSLQDRAVNRYELRFYIEILYTRILCMISVERQVLLINEIVGEHFLDYKSNLTIENINALDNMTKSVGNIELHLKVKMLKAHYWDIQGDVRLAGETAMEIKQTSSTLLLALPLKSATAFLSGETSIQHAIRAMKVEKELPMEQRILDLPEAELEKTAIALCDEMGIPASRKYVVLDGLLTTRKIAQLQKIWCKYIGYIEKKGSGQTVETICAEIQPKLLFCMKKKLVQSTESRNIEDLLPTLKQNLCKDCKYKEKYRRLF